jgi:hypothetical protein
LALNAGKIKGNAAPQERVAQPDMEPGTYPVRLVQVIDMGLQQQRAWQGEAKPPAQDVMLTYEFVDVFMVDKDGKELEDKPRWQSETINLRSFKADLATSTKRIKALDPKDVHEGNLAALVGAPAMATITVSKKGDKTYVNIRGLTPMRDRDVAKLPELVNPTKVFDLEEPDLQVFESLPEWLREKIKGNLKYEGSKLQALLGEGGKAPKADEKVAGPVDEEAEEDDDAQADFLGEDSAPW